jgi:hypothetical protein
MHAKRWFVLQVIGLGCTALLLLYLLLTLITRCVLFAPSCLAHQSPTHVSVLTLHRACILSNELPLSSFARLHEWPSPLGQPSRGTSQQSTQETLLSSNGALSASAPSVLNASGASAAASSSGPASSRSDVSPVPVQVSPTSNPAAGNKPTSVSVSKPLNDMAEVDRRMAQLEASLDEADVAFETGNLTKALTAYTEISGGALRWFDQQRFLSVKLRIKECMLGLSSENASNGHMVQAASLLSALIAEHHASIEAQDFIAHRFRRDVYIVEQLRACSDAESCLALRECVLRLSDVPRPGWMDAHAWSVWRKKDKTVLLQLLEVRIEHERDLSKAAPAPLLVRVDQYHEVVKACDKMVAVEGEGTGDGVELARQSREFAVEAMLWMAESCQHIASTGDSWDACMAACERGVETAKAAMGRVKDLGSDADVRQSREAACKEMLGRLKEQVEILDKDKEEKQEREREISRALDEQRRIEEEARAAKKVQQEEKQRKAREERARKEQEKKERAILEREEAEKKKKEEIVQKKREAEEKKKATVMRAEREERERMAREEEERERSEQQEAQLAQAIAEAKVNTFQLGQITLTICLHLHHSLSLLYPGPHLHLVARVITNT